MTFKSPAKEPEANETGPQCGSGSQSSSRVVDGRTSTATCELTGVTAGETAPHFHRSAESASDIKALEAEVKRLGDELEAAEQRLTDAKIAICGVAIGNIVVKGGKRYRVTGIDVSWTTSPPWLKGVQQLKDGSWGATTRNLYGSWTKELQEIAP